MSRNLADTLHKILNRSPILFDTETTGFSNHDKVIEVSAIDADGSPILSTLINPGRRLPKEITALTGITGDMLDEASPFIDAAPRIREAFEGRVAVGWNAAFDERMLANEFRRIGEASPLGEVIDVMPIVARILNGTSQMKLVAAKEAPGIGETQDHRSLSDCYDLLAVIREVIRREAVPDLFSEPEEERPLIYPAGGTDDVRYGYGADGRPRVVSDERGSGKEEGHA